MAGDEDPMGLTVAVGIIWVWNYHEMAVSVEANEVLNHQFLGTHVGTSGKPVDYISVFLLDDYLLYPLYHPIGKIIPSISNMLGRMYQSCPARWFVNRPGISEPRVFDAVWMPRVL